MIESNFDVLECTDNSRPTVRYRRASPLRDIREIVLRYKEDIFFRARKARVCVARAFRAYVLVIVVFNNFLIVNVRIYFANLSLTFILLRMTEFRLTAASEFPLSVCFRDVLFRIKLHVRSGLDCIESALAFAAESRHA